jgi:hypothetical protein
MKKFNFKPILIIAFTGILLSACSGLNKMKKNADQIQFDVTPELLEAHAGEVDVAINSRFPTKYFNKKATLEITPVLKYEGGDAEFESVSVQGEKVEANNRVISFNSGGSISYNDAVEYNDEMRVSELYVNITASQGAKSVDFDPIKIADGVVATSELIVNMPKAILGVRREANNSGKYDPNIDPFQRIVPDEMLADIHYLINRSNLRNEELTAEDVQEYLKYTQNANEEERIDLKDIEVSAYASPDGEIDFNTDLAANRKNTSSDFLAKQLKEAGIDIDLKTRYKPEDWEGFKEMLEASDIQDKELILRVLSMYDDPEVREREIRNLSEVFTVLADQILPKLRRAKLLTSVDLIGKTDAELKALAKSGAVAVLLPGAYLSLAETQPPPIEALRDSGAPIAVASDCNPGTAPFCSLRTAMLLASRLFRMTPLECLAGSTREAARALGLSANRGTLEVGKRADIAIWDIDHPRDLTYWTGTPQLSELLLADSM